MRAGGQKFCFACGAAIDATHFFCPHCGAAQGAVPPPLPSRSIAAAPVGSRNKLAAALLALFLGGIGMHRFYLGRPGSGVVYLLFCWTFIPAIVAFFEAIRLLTMNEERFAAYYP
jgi:hypothetical protein